MPHEICFLLIDPNYPKKEQEAQILLCLAVLILMKFYML